MIQLTFRLLTDTTFGRGDGVAGLVDAEVEYTPTTGLPFLRGRTLKGLLVEECSNLLYAMDTPMVPKTIYNKYEEAALLLFGQPGSTHKDQGRLRFGRALLPEPLRKAVRYAIQKKQITPEEVLDTLTAIRRQSSIDPLTDAPREHSLRAMRVVLRDTPFEAVIDERLVLNGELIFEMEEPRALLAGCVLAFRRAGTGRNRGRGRLHEVRLCENGRDVTADWFEPLKSKLLNSTAS